LTTKRTTKLGDLKTLKSIKINPHLNTIPQSLLFPKPSGIMSQLREKINSRNAKVSFGLSFGFVEGRLLERPSLSEVIIIFLKKKIKQSF